MDIAPFFDPTFPPPLANPSHPSFLELLDEDYLEPLKWGQKYLDLFHCTFSIHPSSPSISPSIESSKESADPSSDPSDIETSARELADSDSVERLSALTRLMEPYIHDPYHTEPLKFGFDYSTRIFLQRFPMHGLYILAHEPISICLLVFDEVYWHRRQSTEESDERHFLLKLCRRYYPQAKPRLADYLRDPYIAAAAIATAQRLAQHRLYASTTLPDCSCRYYKTHIIAVADWDRANLYVYTASISSAILEFNNFPRRRPARCDNNTCYNIDFQVTPIAYEPYESLPVRLSTFLDLEEIDNEAQRTQEAENGLGEEDGPRDIEQKRPPPMRDAPFVMRDWYVGHRLSALEPLPLFPESNDASPSEQQKSSLRNDAPGTKRRAIKKALKWIQPKKKIGDKRQIEV